MSELKEPGDAAARAHHDMGGVAKFLCEPIDTAEHTLSGFDREVDAVVGLLRIKRLLTVDEMRRAIEAIPEAEYHRLGYYERWVRATADCLMTQGVLTPEELRAALA